MRILIVDDQKKTADFICKGLSENHLLAEAAYNGSEALYALSETPFDLVVLDVLLPDIDGWTVLRKLRERHPYLPVLMLSACDDIDSRVKGLNSGADDYLIKPFSFNELLARIRTLLRRKSNEVIDRLSIDTLTLDLQKHSAYRHHKKLHLSPKEFMLLAFLMRRSGDVLSRTVIAEQVWDIHFQSNTNVIDVAIKRLREKVDQDEAIKLIHTVRGAGYVLEAR